MFGKCGECGFLAMRDRQTRLLAEVETRLRQTGEMPQRPAVRGTGHDEPVYESDPICFRHAFELNRESAEWGEASEPERLLRIFDRDRECSQFTSWQPGFSPKEHADMIRDIEAARAQLARDNSTQKFLADQAELNRRQNRRSQIVCLLAVAFAVLGAIAGPFIGVIAAILMNQAITVTPASFTVPQTVPQAAPQQVSPYQAPPQYPPSTASPYGQPSAVNPYESVPPP